MRYDIFVYSFAAAFLYFLYEWIRSSRTAGTIAGYIACALLCGFGAALINLMMSRIVDSWIFFLISSIAFSMLLGGSDLGKKIRAS